LLFAVALESNMHLTLKMVSSICDDFICLNCSWISSSYWSWAFTLSLSSLLFYLFSIWLLHCDTSPFCLILLTCIYSWKFLVFLFAHVFCHLDLLHVLVSVDEASHVGSISICVWRGVNCRYLTLSLLVKWWPCHRSSWCVAQRARPASWVLCPTQMLWTLQSLTFLLFLRCVLFSILNIALCT
jgi:hypothetical protein